jgi:thiamine biosynthesis lipoprotein
MHSESFRAMGTTVTVTLEDAIPPIKVRNLFEHVEQVCSRFLDHSELNRVNRSSQTTMDVSPLLADVLAVANTARRLTGGLVDPAVGQLVAAWGYDRTFSEVRDLDEPPLVPPTDTEWRVEGSRLYRPQGVHLDLGGIAKGWTADLAVELGLATIVNAGGDLRSVHPDTIVDIDDPSGGVAASVRVGNGALATSSIAKRAWMVGDRRAHHIIDPRTGAPGATPIVSASVLADQAALAEAGAKAILLLGEEGLSWADEQNWIRGAIVVWQDGSVYATTGTRVA